MAFLSCLPGSSKGDPWKAEGTYEKYDFLTDPEGVIPEYIFLGSVCTFPFSYLLSTCKNIYEVLL
jgi:hypothetical protein